MLAQRWVNALVKRINQEVKQKDQAEANSAIEYLAQAAREHAAGGDAARVLRLNRVADPHQHAGGRARRVRVSGGGPGGGAGSKELRRAAR